MFTDIMEVSWKDRDSGRLNKIMDLEIQEFVHEDGQEDSVVLVWYVDLGTSELHCMSENMFTLKHEACGSHEFA